jgi:hypothetical protein
MMYKVITNDVNNYIILLARKYSPHMTSLSPQGMRVLRQYKHLRAEEMFVTSQCENISSSKKEMNKAVTMLIMKLTLQWLY